MEKKLFLLLIGEDYSFLMELERLIQDIGYEVMASVPTLEQAEQIAKSRSPDLILMDVDRVNGRMCMESLHRLQDLVIPIIAMRSRGTADPFEEGQTISAVDYLFKPINQYALGAAIRQTFRTIAKQDEMASMRNNIFTKGEFLFLKKKSLLFKVLLEDILYIKADDDYTIVYTKQGNFMNTSSLGDLEVVLSHLPFRRVHRSYVVHLPKVTGIDPPIYKLYIEAVEIPFSRKLRRELVGMLDVKKPF